MWPVIILYILLIPSVALYLRVKHTGGKRLPLLLKAFCSGSILLAALIGMLSSKGNMSAYTVLIVTGLLMGLAGDVAIEFSFIAGTLFFGIGHLSYIAAIYNISDNNLPSIPVFIILCLMIYHLYKKSGLSLGKLLVPCAAYGMIILAMLSLATALLCSNLFSNMLFSLLLFFAALLFTVSDALLVVNNFSGSKNIPKVIDYISLYCYFIGQSLFAVSVFIFRS